MIYSYDHALDDYTLNAIKNLAKLSKSLAELMENTYLFRVEPLFPLIRNNQSRYVRHSSVIAGTDRFFVDWRGVS